MYLSGEKEEVKQHSNHSHRRRDATTPSDWLGRWILYIFLLLKRDPLKDVGQSDCMSRDYTKGSQTNKSSSGLRFGFMVPTTSSCSLYNPFVHQYPSTDNTWLCCLAIVMNYTRRYMLTLLYKKKTRRRGILLKKKKKRWSRDTAFEEGGWK